MSDDREWVELNPDRESERRREVETLRRRVKELEDTVLYLTNTVATRGLISTTEAGPVLRMHEIGTRIDHQDGWRP